jgi:hypothetical protein
MPGSRLNGLVTTRKDSDMPSYYVQRYTIDIAVQDFGPTGAPPPDHSLEVISAVGDISEIELIGWSIDDEFIRIDGGTVKLSKDAKEVTPHS